ncbi:PIG-L deacetylase family protein [Poriferisphaera sp. WC338]|uniref:PIG-L deacetylase family protein n=1 Tax=Poriferisphaera sp. WC338 TaxID=3425129 RepID=UPI003D8181C9
MITNKQSIVTLMAHPDDAEIHCGGTLAKFSQLGWDVHIVSLTGGQCGTIKHTPDEIMRIRIKEGTNSAKSINATFHCLEQQDGFLLYNKEILQLCINLFRELNPAVVITHYPFDYHTDHITASKLARTASFLSPAPNSSSIPIKPGMKIPYLYYADANEGKDILGNRVQPSNYVDVSTEVNTVKQMLNHHASQYEWLAEHHQVNSFDEAAVNHMKSRGGEIGVEAAECFVQHRGHAFPTADLFTEIFS